jgi:hypothetical protein
MPEYTTRDPTWDDLRTISYDLHPSDREYLDAYKVTPMDALAHAYEVSSHAQAGCAGGAPFCVFGAHPTNVGGRVWFACTSDAFEKHGRAILRRSTKWIEGLPFHTLHNTSRSDNEKLAFWLGWLGFEPVSNFETMGFPMATYRRERHVP